MHPSGGDTHRCIQGTWGKDVPHGKEVCVLEPLHQYILQPECSLFRAFSQLSLFCHLYLGLNDTASGRPVLSTCGSQLFSPDNPNTCLTTPNSGLRTTHFSLARLQVGWSVADPGWAPLGLAPWVSFCCTSELPAAYCSQGHSRSARGKQVYCKSLLVSPALIPIWPEQITWSESAGGKNASLPEPKASVCCVILLQG